MKIRDLWPWKKSRRKPAPAEVDGPREKAKELERAFMEAPSQNGLRSVREAYEAILAQRPNDWHVLHDYLNFCTCAGFVRKTFELSQSIVGLKQRIKEDFDTGDLGFSVLPTGFAAVVGNIQCLDLPLKAQQLGWSPPERLIIMAPSVPGSVANEALLETFTPHVRVVRKDAGINSVKDFQGYNEMSGTLPLQGKWVFFWQGNHDVQREWEGRKLPPLARLTPAQEARGRDFLRAQGLAEGDSFVCLHVRTDGFYRDGWSLRNADIESYQLAIQEITAAGMWVFRMGDPAMPPLSAQERVIDYARHPQREDVLDIFLAAKCHFFVGTNSGFGGIPKTFGRPGLLTNYMPWGIMPWSTRDLVMPKLLREKSTGRVLTARECLQEPVGFIQDLRHLKPYDLECVVNTPEELRDGVRELMETVAAQELPSPTKEQVLFAQIEKEIGLARSNCRFSASFARAHPELWR